MIGLIRYLFIFVISTFILFFFFKYLKETKIYRSKRWRKRVRVTFLLLISSVTITALTLGAYVYIFEGVH
ncbi:hypothetical protein SeF6a_053 [Salmonella phage SeF6a]|nr:hypothetical protein SeF6a_053 [Salmonella phage SeF6a]